MKLPIPVLILCIVALATADKLFGPNSEAQYKWRAIVRAGTHHSSSFASAYALKGLLTIQTQPEHTVLQLTNLEHRLYNGELDHHKEMLGEYKPLDAPALQPMQTPFRLTLEEGLVKEFATEQGDPEFVRNMKKSIASIMQLDSHVFKMAADNFGFVRREPSLYGEHNMDYTVVRYGEMLEVRKMHSMNTSAHLYKRMVSNLEPLPCDRDFEQALMHDSQRKYEIVRMKRSDGGGEAQVPREIEAIGAIVYYPFQAKSDEQYIVVNQTFTMEKMTFGIAKPLEMKSERKEHDLTHQIIDETKPDLTQGRHPTHDHAKLLPQAKQMLAEMADYFKHDHIEAKKPDGKRGQAVNRAQQLMRFFTLEQLHSMCHELEAKPEELDMFHHLLPMIGTRASTLMVRDLIKENKLSKEMAVSMLETMHETIYTPNGELIKEMEDMMHLDEKVAKPIRRAAMFAFGSMVHKAMKSSFRKPEEVDQFEKYVVELVGQIKKSDDMTERTVLLHVLFNMKHKSILKHLMPALRTWNIDHHIKSMVLWAMAPVVLGDAEKAIEIFWPMMADRDQHLEVRATAYYFIMESKPDSSQLTNIFWMMMQEPSEELYHLHYTYVKSMMENNEPCFADFGMRMRQLMKFMHPPSHGASFVEIANYRDKMYGFSGGMSTFGLSTNTSQLVTFMLHSQLFSMYTQDHMVHFKINGMRRKMTNDWSSFAMALMDPKMRTTDFFVDIVVMKQQQVINQYHFDEKNHDDLGDIMDLLKKEQTTMKCKKIKMQFERFHQVFIPNDLGMTAVWEFLAPSVMQTEFEVKKTAKDKMILDLEMEARMAIWMHFRHGLSFYNSMEDVWQGVTRTQAFDLSIPMNLEMAINLKQKSLQLTMKKSDDVLQSTGGMRTHVKQLVFIRDEDEKKDYIEVRSDGMKNAAKEIVLIDEDDLNTGHKYKLAFFDTPAHITNGTFRHFLATILDPRTKTLASPLSYPLLSLAHFTRHMRLSPYPSQHGLVLRIAPSAAVSEIDLSMRIGALEADGPRDMLNAGLRFNTRLTYALKSAAQTLKTWDLTANFDLNEGHTLNTVKMFITRKIPNQKDYKVCVEGMKKYTGKGVSGHLNVAMSQSPDGKCSKESTVIDVTMLGERSNEQNEMRRPYEACDYTKPYAIATYQTLHCLAARTSVRHYTYQVKTTNVPSEFKKSIAQLFDEMRALLMDRYTFEDEHNEDIGEHNLKIEVLYPMQKQEIDVKLTTKQHIHRIEGVPTDDLREFGVMPDTMMYSSVFLKLHEMGDLDHCHVTAHTIEMNDEERKEEMSAEWMTYFAKVENRTINDRFKIEMKKMDKMIAVKVTNGERKLELEMKDGKIEVMIDGQKIQMQEFYFQDWLIFQMISDKYRPKMALMLPEMDVHMEYDGHEVMMLMVDRMMMGEIKDTRKCYASFTKMM